MQIGSLKLRTLADFIVLTSARLLSSAIVSFPFLFLPLIRRRRRPLFLALPRVHCPHDLVG